MSAEVVIHDCVETHIETRHDGDCRWTTYTFTDARGEVVEVTAFQQTARQALKGKLVEFVKEQRERFETSSAVGA